MSHPGNYNQECPQGSPPHDSDRRPPSIREVSSYTTPITYLLDSGHIRGDAGIEISFTGDKMADLQASLTSSSIPEQRIYSEDDLVEQTRRDLRISTQNIRYVEKSSYCEPVIYQESGTRFVEQIPPQIHSTERYTEIHYSGNVGTTAQRSHSDQIIGRPTSQLTTQNVETSGLPMASQIMISEGSAAVPPQMRSYSDSEGLPPPPWFRAEEDKNFRQRNPRSLQTNIHASQTGARYDPYSRQRIVHVSRFTSDPQVHHAPYVHELEKDFHGAKLLSLQYDTYSAGEPIPLSDKPQPLSEQNHQEPKITHYKDTTPLEGIQFKAPVTEQIPPKERCVEEGKKVWEPKSFKKPCLYQTKKEKAAAIVESGFVKLMEPKKKISGSSIISSASTGGGVAPKDEISGMAPGRGLSSSTGGGQGVAGKTEDALKNAQRECKKMEDKITEIQKTIVPCSAPSSEDREEYFNRYKNYYWQIYSSAYKLSVLTADDSMPRLSKGIWSYFLYHQLSENKYFCNIKVCNELQALLMPSFKEFSFLLTGSMLSGLALINSNINVNIVPPTATACLPNTESIPISVHIHQVTKILMKEEATSDYSISECSNPTWLRLTWLKDDLTYIHLAINDHHSVNNTQLNFLYTQCDWRFRPLYCIIRNWADNKSLSGRYDTIFSSYSISILVIYFLQNGIVPPVLPCIQECKGVVFDTDHCKPFDISKHSNFKWVSTNNNSLGELLKKFFEFYKVFDFKNKVISIRSSKPILRQIPQQNDNYDCIYIQEPFSLNNAITNNIHSVELHKFVSDLRAASELIDKDLLLEGLLGKYNF